MMTSAVHTPSSHHEKNLFNTISKTALLVGLLDIAAAFFKFYIENDGKSPIPVLRYIASGVFGKQAASGYLMIVWGIVFHFMISFFFTLFFFLLYSHIIKWTKNKIIAGIAYGIFIWTMMNFLVTPLSAAIVIPLNILNAIIEIFILIGMVGIPSSIIAHKYYSGKDAKPFARG